MMTEKQWNRLFREILQSPALELDKALSNLISQLTLLGAGE